MRPGQQNKQRMRGRGRKGPNPLSRSYESNGPDVKIRGTAQHVAEKYTTLARDASASGDRVMAENYLQHAEHYGRIVAAAQGSFQLQQDENDFGDQMDDDGDEDGGVENGYNGGPNGNGQNGSTQHGSQNGQAFGQDRQQDRSQNDRGQQDRGSYDRNPGGGQGGQPQMREVRDGNRNRDANGNRDGNRDMNRDARDNRPNGNRDGQNVRDGQNRDFQARDGQNREGGNRDYNRDNRDGFQNREPRVQRERPTPNGLGPQPVLPVSQPVASEAQPRDPSLRDHAQREPAQRESVQRETAPRDNATQDLATRNQSSADQPPREDVRPDAPSAEREPRRRGRPRRIRSDESFLPLTTAQPGEATSRTTAEGPTPPAAAP
ncbi:MAG: DUF4167 domain-containing protein, partial [Rhizobiaceae bacterium]|nr:DUF4167 domain-containing protein [Rhizobiaceae bacterium]